MRNDALVLVALAGIMLLMVGCAQEKEGTTDEPASQTRTTSLMEGEETTPKHALDHEVRITSDGFFPAVYDAKEGEEVMFVFLLKEPRFISLEDLFAEEVQHGVIEVEFPKSGLYTMICHDCEDQDVATVDVT